MICNIYHGLSKLSTYNGQIFNLNLGGKEIFHNGGDPTLYSENIKGWKNTELVMATIIGKAPFIEINGKRYPHDQHGLSRSLDWQLDSMSQDTVTFVQKYIKNTRIRNIKYLQKGVGEQFISHPNSFSIYKTAVLSNKDVAIKFILENNGTEDMYFQKGWHPAFRRDENDKKDFFVINGREIPFSEVKNHVQEKGAMKLKDVNEIVYVSDALGEIQMETKGYGDLMLWTNHDSLICMEPVTHLIKKDNHIIRPGEHYILKPKLSMEFETNIRLI